MFLRYFLVLPILLLAGVSSAGIPVQGPYTSPTKQLVKRDGRSKIEKELLNMSLPKALFPFFDSIAEWEDWGHLGYHGASQGYRIYQDIIRFTMEEILQIPVREDFQFLRIPGDKDLNLNSIEEFYQFWGKLDNKSDKRAKQLLSMNFAIYSNYDHKGSCSLHLFVKDKSKTNVNFIAQLTLFFSELGIAKEALHDLFDIARNRLDEEGGILLQLFETSHFHDTFSEAYNFADTQGYPAKRGGYKYGNYSLSNQFERIMAPLYLSHQIDIAPQLRLLINNKFTLNPYSYLSVRRWDLYPRETIIAYEQEMRSYIRSLPFDELKASKYREELFDLWMNKNENNHLE